LSSHNRHQRHQQESGFTIVEASLVLMIIFIITGIALLDTTGMIPRMHANEALNQAVAQLRNGREQAIAQRRNVEIRFLDENKIQLVRFDVPGGTTTLSTVSLGNEFTFQVFGGLPDTPDAFGNSGPLDFGGADSLIFLSDGTLVDSNGSPVSGTVFIGLSDHPETARAVTILGATGRVRGYLWTGSAWIH